MINTIKCKIAAFWLSRINALEKELKEESKYHDKVASVSFLKEQNRFFKICMDFVVILFIIIINLFAQHALTQQQESMSHLILAKEQELIRANVGPYEQIQEINGFKKELVSIEKTNRAILALMASGSLAIVLVGVNIVDRKWRSTLDGIVAVMTKK